MVSKNSRRNWTILLTIGAIFFAVTLYSGQIIAALVKSDLLSVNLENISSDGETKNTIKIANQQLEDVTSSLQNAEKMLETSNQEFAALEMARKNLQDEKEKLTTSIERLKFERVDQQNKKKLLENNKGKLESELEILRGENDQLKNKVNSLDKIALEKDKLEKSIRKLEEKNRNLTDQLESVPDKEKLLGRSKELESKILSLNEQLTTQKMLIEGYES
ncbi:MAG: hypothetical protein VXW39_00380, partial [Pseudomonadota bacterium]|nr:hypothetical protein [Pseudomonadota bacterium]